MFKVARPRRENTRWAQRDIRYLTEKYQQKDLETLARLLSRSKRSVIKKLCELNLIKWPVPKRILVPDEIFEEQPRSYTQDGVGYIALTGKHGRGKFALVDDDLFEDLSRHNWHTGGPKHPPARSAKVSEGEILARPKGSRAPKVLLHRFIMAPPADMEVDHINGNVLDNRRLNLRICTRQQNLQNRSGWSEGSFKGVHFSRGYWVARVSVACETPEEAALVYNRLAELAFGDFAKANVID